MESIILAAVIMVVGLGWIFRDLIQEVIVKQISRKLTFKIEGEDFAYSVWSNADLVEYQKSPAGQHIISLGGSGYLNLNTGQGRLAAGTYFYIKFSELGEMHFSSKSKDWEISYPFPLDK